MLKTRCGTPNYTAPEIFHATSYSGPPVDVWSCGAILYVMLAAALPFDAPNIQELARQILSVSITYPKNFPPGATDLLQKIFIADPSQRATIDQIKAHPWFVVGYKPIKGSHEARSCIRSQVSLPSAVTAQAPAAPPESDDDMDVFSLIAKVGSVQIERLVDQSLPANASTTFTTAKPEPEARRIIKATLDGLMASTVNTKGHQGFKSAIPIGSSEVSVRIDLHRVTAQTLLIELSRMKGGQFDFLRVYRTIKQRLA
jgi:5'-AMP-activated protein kinase catalytic alpha subunit